MVIEDEIRGAWRRPSIAEAHDLAAFYRKQHIPLNAFFTIWTLAGVLGTIGSVISIIFSIIEEPESAAFMILSGLIGIPLIYLFFFKLGRYIKNVALRRELDAIENGHTRLCVVIVKDKLRKIRHLSDANRHIRYNHYIKADVADDAGDTSEQEVLITRYDYCRAEPGRLAVLVCHGSLRADNMHAYLADTFIEKINTTRGASV